ncbi:FKBP-type peptidyl-prolyl cis-trans isomerase [Marinagarivorans cellulosilyticus]|uniref:Peptidyl-prolyl cis-trans isomerase n=1 Tax=Marinagarivorans cellulosilyticus TaxID=2721545 RepID=A0AAN1WFA9_9GAMM|nr:peptidylprolyl isomerase [Marinagarivorans cellulosilyticus]BCD96554.1 FKBP-type peptidyl-prolyl cis-trans isomerase SlpA [Marinagarivorans cellulosilyticus]
MHNLAIADATKVTLNFSLSLEDGTVVDSNHGEDPVTFTVGDGNLLEGFEKAMYGLRAGDEREITILPEQGFGQPNENNVQEVPVTDFPEDLTLEVGLMLSFSDAQNTELPGVIKALQGETVLVDFNHPLAGRTLLFKVHIHSVSPAVTH